jgi:hypothetical protein
MFLKSEMQVFSEIRPDLFLLCFSVVSLWNIDVYSKRLVFGVILIYTPSTFSCIFFISYRTHFMWYIRDGFGHITSL